jgi:hypothetical protein
VEPDDEPHSRSDSNDSGPTSHSPPFQSGGTAWHPDRADIDSVLAQARQIDMRSIYYGSNACYLIVLEHPLAGRSLAVYKPARGEYPLWDFPPGSLYRREIATYQINRLLRWNIVPATVEGSGRLGRGSIQLFIEESASGEIEVSALRHMILLDWITNNADRKADHLLVSDEGRLWGIDHGLTFHVDPKLRTVLWHFAGETLSQNEIADLTRIRDLLAREETIALDHLLQPDESAALLHRINAILRNGVFPDPQRKAMPYRW